MWFFFFFNEKYFMFYPEVETYRIKSTDLKCKTDLSVQQSGTFRDSVCSSATKVTLFTLNDRQFPSNEV